MSILNSDGSVYRTTGEITAFDPGSPDYDLFQTWDAESIRIGGTPIYYFQVFITQGAIDDTYQESRSKIWSQHPTQLFCFYEPTIQTNINQGWGIDAPDAAMFEFNYRDVLNTLGHPPKLGSRLFTPHLRENWEIVEFVTGEYRGWGVVRLQMHCKKFQESLTNSSGDIPQPTVNYRIS